MIIFFIVLLGDDAYIYIPCTNSQQKLNWLCREDHKKKKKKSLELRLRKRGYSRDCRRQLVCVGQCWAAPHFFVRALEGESSFFLFLSAVRRALLLVQRFGNGVPVFFGRR